MSGCICALSDERFCFCGYYVVHRDDKLSLRRVRVLGADFRAAMVDADRSFFFVSLDFRWIPREAKRRGGEITRDECMLDEAHGEQIE